MAPWGPAVHCLMLVAGGLEAAKARCWLPFSRALAGAGEDAPITGSLVPRAPATSEAGPDRSGPGRQGIIREDRGGANL